MNSIVNLRFNNIFSVFIYFFILISGYTFLYGYLDNNFNNMLVAILILWTCNTLHCLENFKSRFLFFVFNFVIFVFLVSRPTIDLFRKSSWQYFDKKENLFALVSIYISLLFLFIGNKFGDIFYNYKLNQLKNKNLFQRNTYIKSLENISLFLFYLSVCMLLVVELEKFFYMHGKNYEEIYVSFHSNLPFFVNIIASMCKYFLCIFLSTMPSKRKALAPMIIYTISFIPYFLIGARFKLVINVLFILVYYIIRSVINNKEKWIGFWEKLLLAVGGPISIAFLGAYNYIREGKKLGSMGLFDLILDFFYKQGVSFDVLRIGYKTIPNIKYTGFVNYSFGEILDYILHGNIAQILWNAKSFGVGQTETLGLYSNLLANRIAYTASKGAFLSGHGWGGSYLLDTYADWGYLGVILFSLFLGIVFSSMIYFIKKNTFSCCIVLIILNSIYYIPRSSAFYWAGFAVYIQFYIPVITCVIISAMLVKTYTVKNHLEICSNM